MKRIQSIVPILVTIAIVSCKTHIEPEIGDIEDIRVEAFVTSKNGLDPKSEFKLGDKIKFFVSETNTNRKVSVRYAHYNVAGQYPVYGCDVYNDNGDLIGDVEPEGAAFNLVYIINELTPGKTKFYSLTWDTPQINAQGDTFINVPLSKGNYVMKFSYTLVGHNRGDIRKFNDRPKKVVAGHFPFSIK